EQIAVRDARDVNGSAAVALAIFQLLAGGDGRDRSVGLRVDDGHGLWIALDHEDMAGGAVECDRVGVHLRRDFPDDLEAAEVERDRFAVPSIIGEALVRGGRDGGSVSAAGNPLDLADEVAAPG